ncbi:MAG: hypothetical protein JST92_13655 [Deltaproteobacteria bacterium]|nr:hypothetical protein [Deltaproteobacteria bacterium]
MKKTILFAMLMMSAVACELPLKARQGATLGDTKVPPGFTFKTTRGVDVSLTASQALLPSGTGHLKLSLADGRVLFDGALKGNLTERKLHLSLPMKDRTLIATLDAGSGKIVRTQVEVPASAATVYFQ